MNIKVAWGRLRQNSALDGSLGREPKRHPIWIDNLAETVAREWHVQQAACLYRPCPLDRELCLKSVQPFHHACTHTFKTYNRFYHTCTHTAKTYNRYTSVSPHLYTYYKNIQPVHHTCTQSHCKNIQPFHHTCTHTVKTYNRFTTLVHIL